MRKLLGGIEFGGTKNICAVGDAAGNIEKRTTIPTTTPTKTMPKIIEYFKKVDRETPLSALGIASFGPLDLNPHSPKYGYITTTPKLAWTDFNLLGALKSAFDLPIGFDTDVNGAALAEYFWGAAKGLDTIVYWTIGTGIGAGGIVSGKIMHGLLHPEMGHVFIPHDRTKDPFDGVCPYHKDCLEGLASGPSLKERWHVNSALDLPPDHKAWDIEAEYLAYAMATCIMTLSPQKIVLGGGVMKQKQLFPKIRHKTLELLNNYVKHKTLLQDIDNYIVPPGLEQNAGICGAIALAQMAYGK